MIAFKPFLFRFESPWCKGNRGLSAILISPWMGTLVRATQITSNPFTIAKSGNNQSLNEKKISFTYTFDLDLYYEIRFLAKKNQNLCEQIK
jgi:hypothetical protein